VARGYGRRVQCVTSQSHVAVGSFAAGMNVVGCKWVFRAKRKANGSIEQYKARHVVKGFNQVARYDSFVFGRFSGLDD